MIMKRKSTNKRKVLEMTAINKEKHTESEKKTFSLTYGISCDIQPSDWFLLLVWSGFFFSFSAHVEYHCNQT